MARSRIKVGNIDKVSGEVNIVAGDSCKAYTAEQVLVLLPQTTSMFRPKPFDGRCRYKGLGVFKKAELFFRRERLVEDFVNRVKESPTVFITSLLGGGKSSQGCSLLLDEACHYFSLNGLETEFVQSDYKSEQDEPVLNEPRQQMELEYGEKIS